MDDTSWLARRVADRYGPLAATFLRLAIDGDDDAHNRLRQVFAAGPLPSPIRDWLRRGGAPPTKSSPRRTLTDEEYGEYVRHLSTLDLACIDGPCYHPACAWRYDDTFRVAPLAEHALLERNPLLPRDFTLPRIEDEDD